MTKKLLSAAVVAGTLLAMLAPLASFAATTSAFSPGDLIKGSGDTVYYFAPDGHRYVFPNSKTYFTWYKDFSMVKQIPDGQLGEIPLGRTNVTYRPGYKMVKVTTDPKTYVVDQGGILRWVQSEQLAETLYGLNWKDQIDDVPDAYFTNYKVGTPIQTASDYNPADIMTQTTTISQDKQFDETKAAINIGSVNDGFVPTSITVKKGTTVTWTNGDVNPHTVTTSDWDSGNIAPAGTYSWTYTSDGSFDYHDADNTTMQGTVNVVN
ncbi:MAG: cupredoxin domain-containing protein [Patescibacteria group bacterium]